MPKYLLTTYHSGKPFSAHLTLKDTYEQAMFRLYEAFDDDLINECENLFEELDREFGEDVVHYDVGKRIVLKWGSCFEVKDGNSGDMHIGFITEICDDGKCRVLGDHVFNYWKTLLAKYAFENNIAELKLSKNTKEELYDVLKCLKEKPTLCEDLYISRKNYLRTKRGINS